MMLEYDYLIQLINEIKNLRVVLERMSFSPVFREGDVNNIAYICDQTACIDCTHDSCMHTTNIDHAKNFKCENGKYIEYPICGAEMEGADDE